MVNFVIPICTVNIMFDDGFDLQRKHAAELYNRAQLAGTAVGKRARDAIKGAHRMPSKAHLEVTSLPRLLNVYKHYGCTSSGAT